MGKSNLGWLQSNFHFSFADYQNPDNISFGPLRVINDDTIAPHSGFDTHPHRDMEILTYVLEGELSHKDSMGNDKRLSRGHVQYLSAGTGITHSEHNKSDKVLRLLQIWIWPDRGGHTPQYGQNEFEWDLRVNRLMPIASNDGYPIRINQDVRIDALWLESGRSLEYTVHRNRQVYLVLAEGQACLNDVELGQSDGAEVLAGKLNIRAKKDSHLLLIEMSSLFRERRSG